MVIRQVNRKRYVYWWADGIYLTARMDDAKCVLVIMGVTELGHKELIAIEATPFYHDFSHVPKIMFPVMPSKYVASNGDVVVSMMNASKYGLVAQVFKKYPRIWLVS